MLFSQPRSIAAPYSFLKENVGTYLSKFCVNCEESEKERRIVEAILTHTRSVSESEFTTALLYCGQTLIQELETLRNKNLPYLWYPIGLTPNKSNDYVFQKMLALNHQLLETMDFRWESRRNSNQVLVYIDDAIYTALQIRDKLEQEIMHARQKGNISIIFIVIPYVSNCGKAKLSAFFKNKHPNIPWKIIFKETIHTMCELNPSFQDFARENLEELFRRDGYPIIFPHKVPDHISGYPEIYSGYVPKLTQEKDQCHECKRRYYQYVPLIKNYKVILEYPTSCYFDASEQNDPEYRQRKIQLPLLTYKNMISNLFKQRLTLSDFCPKL